MKLYMVRHGESEHNARKIHQTPENPLSEQGLRQAKNLANRFKQIKNIDIILSSDFMRAKQTAEIISSETGHEIVLTEFAREKKTPTEVIGTPWEGEKMQEIKSIIKIHQDDPEWHYSDEENFFEQRNRALKLIEYIESFGDKNIILVSHGHFIRLIVAIMMLGPNLTPSEYEKIEDFMKTKNTGITLCEKRETAWHLTTWNDHAHLG